jgi:acetoin utilization deacetylase AcuC-like enzyme
MLRLAPDCEWIPAHFHRGESGDRAEIDGVKCSYHEAYQTPLPAGHPFPMSKYPLLKNLLLEARLLVAEEIVRPEPLDRATLELVHTQEYLDKLASSGLSPAEIRRLGVPWSEALWLRSRIAAAGTLLAARYALREGIAANLAGGTHHAFADRAEGFCVLNDAAIAIRQLQAEGEIRRALIVDLDVHQGNGTAAIFAGDTSVFTFSMHGDRNYPVLKQRSSLDVALPDGMQAAAYLQELKAHLPRAIAAADADIVFYLAGVDVASGDRYGRLQLSDAGIQAREHYVIDQVRGRGLPIAIALSGGYAPTPLRTAELHTAVFRAAHQSSMEKSSSSDNAN